MSDTLPTVKVVSPSAPGGFVIINVTDLTSDHEIFEAADAEKTLDETTEAQDGKISSRETAGRADTQSTRGR
jgi:hypothetical protein